MSKKTCVCLEFCSADLVILTKMQIPKSCLNTDIYGKLPSLLWLPQQQQTVSTVPEG